MEFVLTGCRLIDGTGHDPVPEAAIHVRDGRIVWAGPLQDLRPAEARLLPQEDVSGLTAIPGLIDAHAHVSWNGRESVLDSARRERDQLLMEGVTSLRAILASGTTTLRDVGGQDYVEMALRWGVEAGHIPGPRMRTSGKLICMTGGHAYFAAREADGPEDVRKAAREQVKAGADTVKLMATGGAATPGQDIEATQLTLEEMAAGVQAAHAMGRTAAAHAHGTRGIKNAVLAGIDSVEHGSFLDEEAADMMVAHGTALVLTLGIANTSPEDVPPGAAAEVARIRATLATLSARLQETVSLARAKGVRICSGSDCGGSPVSPHDFSMALEAEALVAHGFSCFEVISILTRDNAALLRLDKELGTLEAGRLADLVLLEADPTEDIHNLRRVKAVFKGGVRYG